MIGVPISGALRFIPACAGNTRRASEAGANRSVHPRMRGEHIDDALPGVMANGSSPHARGTHRPSDRQRDAPRFIPACAGNTGVAVPAMPRAPVHPRMRGEHTSRPPLIQRQVGSSPHARGTPVPCHEIRCISRFIPACAGNTRCQGHLSSHSSVHPRMRGEHINRISSPCQRAGSSPHARGTRGPAFRLQRLARFIPACAGNTRTQAPRQPRWAVHPRMRGEHEASLKERSVGSGSSPHARGTRFIAPRQYDRRRFIPACAGNTRDGSHQSRCRPVHPRMRGEHVGCGRCHSAASGSSPHARGTRKRRGHRPAFARFIPACAGNT